MKTLDILQVRPKEYYKTLKGTLLAVLAGVTVQGCTRVDSETSSIIPTSPVIETKQSGVESKTGIVPKIIIKEGAPEEPVITIMGPEPSAGSSTQQQEVPVTIVIDGPTETSPASPSQDQPALTASFDGQMPSKDQDPLTPEATVSQCPSTQQEMPGTIFESLEPEKLSQTIKKIEQGTVDDEISENGRQVEIYSSPLKNGMSVVLVKETIQKYWPEMQSSIVFNDEGTLYVAYNTVKFGTRMRGDGTQELRFGKGKSSAIVRNAYVSPDSSKVSVLLSTRRVDDSWQFLANNGALSIYQNREETDLVTLQKTINIGGYVVDQQKWMREQEWLLDQAESNRIYSIGRQSDGKFRRESIGDPVEINPTKNLE